MTAGVVGIVGFTLGSIQQTISLVQGVKGAPTAVNAIVEELNSLKVVLETLTKFLTQTDLRDREGRSEFLRLLNDPLLKCVSYSHDIREKLKPYIRTDGAAKVSTWRGLSWFLHEKEFLALRRNLDGQKSALEIAVSVVNL